MTMRWTFLTMSFTLLAAAGANAQNRPGARSIPNLSLPATLAFLHREARRAPAERPLIEEPAGSPLRHGILGSMPVAPNLDLRVGLLKVLRGKSSERALARMHPMGDLGGRHERVAAAGLNLSF